VLVYRVPGICVQWPASSVQDSHDESPDTVSCACTSSYLSTYTVTSTYLSITQAFHFILLFHSQKVANQQHQNPVGKASIIKQGVHIFTRHKISSWAAECALCCRISFLSKIIENLFIKWQLESDLFKFVHIFDAHQLTASFLLTLCQLLTETFWCRKTKKIIQFKDVT